MSDSPPANATELTHSCNESGEDSDEALFSNILSIINTSKLSQLAKSIRQRNDEQYNKNGPVIPIAGTPELWDESSTKALISEAKVMQLLKRETTIPLPEVLDFSPTRENIIKCPYIIMTYIEGKSLYDVWFGHRLGTMSYEEASECRNRVLRGLAKAMSQLGNFSYGCSGSLEFHEDMQPTAGAATRCIDNQAELDRWFVHHDPSEHPIYVDWPASTDPKKHYTFLMDLHPDRTSPPCGVKILLRLLIDWFPEPSGMNPFVLEHPDFGFQNVIVADNGELLGIIDWDGVAAVPRSIGNERYPSWLTRDWDPMMYGHTEAMEQGIEPEGLWEDSPAELREARRMYRSFMGEFRRTTSDESHTNLTRISLIAENLAIAAHHPECQAEIVEKIINEILAKSEGMRNKKFIDLVIMAVDGNMDKSIIDDLRKGFGKLLESVE
ncbi:hypothetical protein E8E14_007760 [Neopestalotiopsis sp. 37M]|nr:hypothetical protein E8E14_007760 [Neopestalotiopsis sp. 37M]